MRIEIELLGTGTSYGVPAIGCPCEVCTSDDPRNKRLRSSVVFRVTPADGRERVFLVDVTPDLRQQALRAHLKHLDAILMTHEHADHTAGMDDLRAFYWQSGRKDIPLYAYPETLAALKARFDYLFDRDLEYRGVARVEEHTFEFKPFEVEGVVIQPIPVLHGQMRVSAFRIGDAAYITDTNEVPDTSIQLLKGVRLLILDALRRGLPGAIPAIAVGYGPARGIPAEPPRSRAASGERRDPPRARREGDDDDATSRHPSTSRRVRETSCGADRRRRATLRATRRRRRRTLRARGRDRSPRRTTRTQRRSVTPADNAARRDATRGRRRRTARALGRDVATPSLDAATRTRRRPAALTDEAARDASGRARRGPRLRLNAARVYARKRPVGPR